MNRRNFLGAALGSIAAAIIPVKAIAAQTSSKKPAFKELLDIRSQNRIDIAQAIGAAKGIRFIQDGRLTQNAPFGEKYKKHNVPKGTTIRCARMRYMTRDPFRDVALFLTEEEALAAGVKDGPRLHFVCSHNVELIY